MTADQKSQITPDQGDLDPNSLAAIRELLATEVKVQPKPVAERVAERAAVAKAQTQAAPRGASRLKVAGDNEPQPQAARKSDSPAAKSSSLAAKPAGPAAKPAGPVAKMVSANRARLARTVDGLKAKIMGYRPSGKHIAIAAAVLLLVFRPWLVLGLFFLSAFVLVGVFLILGYDGFWRRVMGLARWYARRHPSRSAEIHKRLDDFAMKFDAFLDRFPEGSVDGLYLPDFGDIAEADARHDAALQRRFESLRE